MAAPRAPLPARLRRALAGALAALSLALAPALRAAESIPPAQGAPHGAVSDHIVVISIDGLRPDAIAKYNAKTLERLIREGASSLEAQTIFPSKTLPSHTSMLTGVPPETHGITWNSDQTAARGTVEVPTLFELARGHGFHTAAFFSKSKFHHLQKGGTLDHTEAPGGLVHLMATETVEAVTRYLEHASPNLLFVHIGEPDYAGHTVGWMSFVYGWAVRRADGGVTKVLEAADRSFGPGNYTVIVTADHGGHGRKHGSSDPRDMTIPWIVWGKGVSAGAAGLEGIQTMDTAATALWLLGVPLPTAWVGRPVAAAFTPAARQAAASARAIP